MLDELAYQIQAILQSYRNKISIALEQKQAVHQWERNGRLKYEYSHLISGKNVKKHTLKKIQYFQQMALGNLDIHIGKIGIIPSGTKAST